MTATDIVLKDAINQKALRQAREAARELDALSRHAAQLSQQVFASPSAGYSATGLMQELASIQARLANAGALFTLTEQD